MNPLMNADEIYFPTTPSAIAFPYTLLPIVLISLVATDAYAQRTPIKNVSDAVNQLKLDLPQSKTRALDWLNRRENKVVDANPHPNDIIEPYLKSDVRNLPLISKVFMKWARSEDAAALIRMNDLEIGSRNIFGFKPIGVLFRVTPEKGREYFEKQIDTKGFQDRARMGIADMGPEVEDAVIPLLKSSNPKVVNSAARILMKIGTEKSFPALDAAAAATDSPGLRKQIEKSKAKIKGRK